MWIVNVALIFLTLAILGWLLLNYRQAIATAFDIFFSSCQSVLFAVGIILIEAVKAAIIAALVGGGVAAIFFIAKSPESTTKAVAFSLASLVFALLVLKALWENFHNIFWSVRNQVRNRNRR
jgi:hypothetical protein